MQARFGFALDEVGDVSNFAGFLLRVASVHASSVRLFVRRGRRCF